MSSLAGITHDTRVYTSVYIETISSILLSLISYNNNEVGWRLYAFVFSICDRLFGLTGHCAACNKTIPAFEMVMRARTNVYHLECFACQQCNYR